jgi:hypothetical protein
MRHDDEVARVGTLDDNPWIITASGSKLFFLDPATHAINLGDIAQCAGNICRFTGATSQFYSVAQHSTFVGRLVKKMLDDEGVDRESVEYWDQILAGLLHDAEEAYVNDLSSPLKTVIRGKYTWIATGIRRVIFEKYGIDWAYYNKTVKDADNIAIVVERYYLIPDHPDWPKVAKSEMEYPPLTEMTPQRATQEFADALRYAMLMRDTYRSQDVA